mgnify:CR=1 FL=1
MVFRALMVVLFVMFLPLRLLRPLKLAPWRPPAQRRRRRTLAALLRPVLALLRRKPFRRVRRPARRPCWQGMAGI